MKQGFWQTIRDWADRLYAAYTTESATIKSLNDSTSYLFMEIFIALVISDLLCYEFLMNSGLINNLFLFL